MTYSSASDAAQMRINSSMTVSSSACCGMTNRPGLVTSLDELPEVQGHRPAVVCDEDSALFGREGENLRVFEAAQSGLVCGLKIYFRRAAKDARYDVLVEVRVGLVSDFHCRGVSASLRARSSRSYQSGCASRCALRIFSNSSSPASR